MGAVAGKHRRRRRVLVREKDVVVAKLTDGALRAAVAQDYGRTAAGRLASVFLSARAELEHRPLLSSLSLRSPRDCRTVRRQGAARARPGHVLELPRLGPFPNDALLHSNTPQEAGPSCSSVQRDCLPTGRKAAQELAGAYGSPGGTLRLRTRCIRSDRVGVVGSKHLACLR